MEKARIAILYGGYSGEHEVSEKTARFVEQYLDPERYIPFLVEFLQAGCFVHEDEGKLPVELNGFSYLKNGERYSFDLAFIAVHGSPGEDGKIQGYLDLIGMPYSTGDLLNTALTFDKAFTKEVLKAEGIHTASYLKFQRSDEGVSDQVERSIGFPCFVKPNRGGSSLGNTKVKEKKELQAALDHAFEIDREVLVEELIEGTELGCGVLRYEGAIATLPLIEIISKNDFFDYEAKYLSGATEEICPARISEEARRLCQGLSAHIYEQFRCKGMIRIDFFLLADATPSVIEINTVPGLSDASLFPQEAQAYGLSFTDMISAVIEDAKP